MKRKMKKPGQLKKARPKRKYKLGGRRKFRMTHRLSTILIVGSLVCLFLAVNLFNNHAREQELREQKVVLDQQLHEAELQQGDLKERIKLLENDDYILQIARSQYLLSKDGEIVFNLIEEEEDKEESEETEGNEETPSSEEDSE